MENKARVKTPLGTLVAEVGGDPDYPEIFVYLEREDGMQIDLTAVSTNGKDDEIKAYLYADTRTDSYTHSHKWTKEELYISEE